MSYYRYRKTFYKPEVVKDVNFPARFDAMLAQTDLNDWEKTFLTSIKTSYEKYQSLTVGQNKTFCAIEERHSPAAVASRATWEASWNEEKNKKWDMMMKYYSCGPYYKGLVEKYRKNVFRIPTESEYKKICENKYAERFYKVSAIPPKFAAQSLVVIHRWGEYRLAMVLEVRDVTRWVKGSREYLVARIDDPTPFVEEERYMLYYRESILPKLKKDPLF